MDFLINVAIQYNDAFLVLHLFAMVIGLGGATYTDILLVKFLKDLKIDAKEKSIIHTMSTVVSLGVLLALLSGIMLFLADIETIIQKPKFQVKVIIFGIIMINGYLLHKIILPRLINFSFNKEHYLLKFLHLRQIGFILGSISAVSWYSVFLLGGFSQIPFSFFQLIIAYLVTLVLAISGSLVIEKYIKVQSQ